MNKIIEQHIRTETQSSKPLIVISGLKKSFGSNEVLKGFNLELYPKENVVILG